MASLIQWFDKVINDTILKDLDKANTSVVLCWGLKSYYMGGIKVSRKQKHLREERLELMRRKVKEEMGHDLDITYDQHVVDETDEELLAMEAESVKEDQGGKETEPNADLNVWQGGKLVQMAEPIPLQEILNMTQPDTVVAEREPTPLSLSKLAPIPSKEALFGDVKRVLAQYELAQQREKEARARHELAVEEKLRRRIQESSKRRTRLQRRRLSTVLPVGGGMLEGIDEVPSRGEREDYAYFESLGEGKEGWEGGVDAKRRQYGMD